MGDLLHITGRKRELLPAQALTATRVREGMARRKAEGVHLGRRTEMPEDVVRRIVASREAGKSLRAIAGELNDEEVPTGQGGARWHASTAVAVLRSTTAARVSADAQSAVSTR